MRLFVTTLMIASALAGCRDDNGGDESSGAARPAAPFVAHRSPAHEGRDGRARGIQSAAVATDGGQIRCGNTALFLARPLLDDAFAAHNGGLVSIRAATVAAIGGVAPVNPSHANLSASDNAIVDARGSSWSDPGYAGGGREADASYGAIIRTFGVAAGTIFGSGSSTTAGGQINNAH